jgi:hypothetical protein
LGIFFLGQANGGGGHWLAGIAGRFQGRPPEGLGADIESERFGVRAKRLEVENGIVFGSFLGPNLRPVRHLVGKFKRRVTFGVSAAFDRLAFVPADVNIPGERFTKTWKSRRVSSPRVA